MYEGWENIPNITERVRGALGIDGSEVTLDELRQFENRPFAELTIKGRVTNWETLSEDKEPVFEACVIYQIAILQVIKALSEKFKVQQTSTLKIERFDVDYDILAELENRLNAMLALLLDDDSGIYSHFTVTNRSV